jgi:hypothetical protein
MVRGEGKAARGGQRLLTGADAFRAMNELVARLRFTPHLYQGAQAPPSPPSHHHVSTNHHMTMVF